MTGNSATIKPWRDLTITDDYMFKAVMKHPRICKRLIEKILNIKISHIYYLEYEKTLNPKYSGKGIRLDVYVEGDNSIYDIEMQVRHYGDKELAYRTRYYQSMIDADIFAKGTKHYSELKKSFIIFLCPFAMFDGKHHIYNFHNFCVQDNNLSLDDGAGKIFLCSEGELDDVSSDIRAFLDYMKGLPVNNEFVTEIDDLVREIKNTEKERVSYMTFEMKMQEAHNDGWEEGLSEGLAQGRAQMAIDMLRDNEPIDKIVKYSRLSLEQVQELAKQIWQTILNEMIMYIVVIFFY